MASAIPSLLLCLLLLSPRLGSSSYRTGFTNGGKHVIRRSSHDSRTPSTSSTAPSGDAGPAGSLPIMHRLSPCSPSTTAGLGQSTPYIGDAFNLDALRLRALFGESADKAGVTIPLTGTPLPTLPGASDYHVAVGFGTPAQELAVGFDTATYGATLLRCNPCVAGDPCDKAFDPSLSSTLAQIPCGSRDCPSKACSAGDTCTFAQSNTMYFKDRRNIFSVVCLAFTDAAEHTPGIAVIGSMAQAGTEVVYDVLGGKLGFVHDRC